MSQHISFIIKIKGKKSDFEKKDNIITAPHPVKKPSVSEQNRFIYSSTTL